MATIEEVLASWRNGEEIIVHFRKPEYLIIKGNMVTYHCAYYNQLQFTDQELSRCIKNNIACVLTKEELTLWLL